MSALERLIDDYCAAWGEFDAARCERMLREVCAEQVRYTDPRSDVTGIAELAAWIRNVQSTRAGAKWMRTSAVDAHHGWARFGWRVVLADGTMLPDGIDIVELSPQGQLQRIVGFFGPLKAS